MPTSPSQKALRIEIVRFGASPVVTRPTRKQGRKQIIEILIRVSPANGAEEAVAILHVGGSRIFEGAIPTGGNGIAHLQIPIDLLKEPSEAKLEVRYGHATVTKETRMPPPRKWIAHMGAGSHTDNGFNFIQPEAQNVHVENTGRAIELARKYADLPFVWNMEVSWHADLFARKYPRKMGQLVQAIKEGRISLQGAYMNVLTHIMHPELLNRLFYSAHAFRRKYGVAIDCATINDIPSFCGMLPAVMAGSGIHYFVSGVNTARACGMGDLLLGKPRQQPSVLAFGPIPRIWEGLDGSRVTTQYSYSYIGPSFFVLGLTQNLQTAQRQVGGNMMDEALETVPGNEIYCQGAYPDNCGLTESFPETIRQWNRLYESPQFVFCRPEDYMKKMERKYGRLLERVRGDGGAFWEDGACSSARETGEARVDACRLFQLEKALVMAFLSSGKMRWPAKALLPAYENLFLWTEHTWGANYSVKEPRSAFTKKQWEIKASYARNLRGAVGSIEQIAARQLRESLGHAKNEIILFDGLSWEHGSVGSIKLGNDEYLMDGATGEPLPQCRNADGSTLFAAAGVPPMGCKIIKAAGGPKRAFARKREVPGHLLENDFYRLEMDCTTGGIARLLDKAAGRELVAPDAPHPFGQLLYVSGGEDSDLVVHYPGTGNRPVSLTEHTIQDPKISLRRDGTLGDTLVVRSACRMIPRVLLEITLHHSVKRIDLAYTLRKRATFANEALYLAFPFHFQRPQIWLETPSAWMEPNKDQLAGGCREWYAVQHALHVKDGEFGLALSAPDSPLFCLEDINRGKWMTDLPIRKGYLYAYLMNNYWNTNFKASQGGRFRFRFSLTSGGGLGRLDALRFGWEICNPPLAIRGQPNSWAGTKGKSCFESILGVRESQILIEACKKAEFSNSIMVRLWETSGELGSATLTVPKSCRSAFLCNLVEERQRKLQIRRGVAQVPISPKGLATVLLEF